jgi:nucleotide-binding universal stress UspA family protein
MFVMTQPILVPLDGSRLAEQALPYAQKLAEPGCQLILLEVGQDEDDLDLLERHADSCASLETAVGDPAEQILRVAKDLNVGLIVMTTRGRGSLGRWAFGSVADAVTRTSPVPVFIVHPRDGDSEIAPVIQRVVVPLDGSPLAEEALPTAMSLARRLGVPVHLVTAIDVTKILPVEMMPAVAFDASLYEETVARLEADATAWLTRTAEQLQHEGVATTWAILRGSPFLAITDAVKPGDVIVMTSRGLGGAKRWLLGSLAEKLIREGPVPVVLVPTGERDNEVPVGGEAAQLVAPVLA